MVASQLADGPSVNTEPPTDARTPVYMFEGASNIIQGGTFNAAGRDIIYNIQSSEEQSKIARSLSNCISDLASGGQQVAKMLKWLSPINFRLAFEENLTKWTPGTGSRVLKSDSFERWLHAKNVCPLWNRHAGVQERRSLCPHYLDHHKAEWPAGCFHLLPIHEPLSVQDILAAVIRQILEDHQQLVALLRPLFDHHNLRNTRPTQGRSSQSPQDYFSQLPNGTLPSRWARRAHPDIQYELVKALDSLGGNLMITSRPIPLLKQVLPDAIFFDRIERQFDDPDHADLAKRALLWVIYSEEPLTLEELRYAVACTPENEPFDETDVVPENILLSACAGLISTEGKRGTTRLIHYTAKTALISILARDYPNPHSVLAQGCIIYLHTYGINDVTTEKLIRSHKSMPLLSARIVQRLLQHPQIDPNIANDSGRTPLLACLLSASSKIDFWPSFAHPGTDINKPKPDGQTPLMEAIECSNDSAAHALLERPSIQVNRKSERGETALMTSSYRNNVAIAKRLTTCTDIDVNARRNGDGYTALTLANSEEMMLVLLHTPGIDVNSASVGLSAIALAAKNGWERAIARLLLFPELDVTILPALASTEADMLEYLDRPGIDINACHPPGYSPVALASSRGWDRALKRLLEFAHIDISVVKKALLLCSTEEVMVQLLSFAEIDAGWLNAARGFLEHPVLDANASDKDGNTALIRRTGRTALMLACKVGWEAAVEEMLAHPKIELNATDNDGVTALMIAAQEGSERIVHLFLGKSQVEVNAQNVNGSTALMVALAHGYGSIVKMLTDHPGTDLNARDKEGKTVLLMAAREDDMCHLLDIPSIQRNVRDNNGRTPLMHAADNDWGGAVAKLLEDPAVDVNATEDGWAWTALSIAIVGGNEQAFRNLVASSRVDVNTRGGRSQMTPLMYATTSVANAVRRPGSVFLSLLLQRPDIDVNATDTQGMTALACAVQSSSPSFIQQLLGVPSLDINIKDRQGRTPLMIAVRECSLVMRFALRCLLAFPSLDVDATDNEGKTALDLVRDLLQDKSLHEGKSNFLKQTEQLLCTYPDIDDDLDPYFDHDMNEIDSSYQYL
ncbi:ankyrin repeat-containing domain protein [Coprinopsis sp. MPI-PUGE-AT-0042]|nr:ankyrin repeat-containing domain protein [Coprinopsis sp. MPI-PUGE-AT-0042]